jgi:hypothetical protein
MMGMKAEASNAMARIISVRVMADLDEIFLICLFI